MARINVAAGLENPLQSVFPVPVVAQRAPTANDKNYPVGQRWINQASDQSYSLSRVTSNSAVWILEGPGSSDVDTLTGDTGGALSPTAGNINILGGDGITVAGSGSTLTINRDAEGGYPTTPYVVGSSGQAGYTTIQSAVDAANSAGGGIVYVQPGTYTEDLTLYDNIQIVTFGFSDSGDGVEIIGAHTPPTSGGFVFRNIKLTSATDVFTSAAAGTAHLIVADCAVAVTNGYLFDLPNWGATGILEMWDVNCGFGTNDGCVNNTGGSTVLCYSGAFGVGSSNTMIVSGDIFTDSAEFFAPTDFQTGATLGIENSIFYNTCTLSNNSTGDITNCSFQTGSSAAITMSSSANITLANCSIDSTNTPAIAGAGAGTLSLTGVDFINDATISSSLTLSGGNTKSAVFETVDAAAGVQISGSDIDADGSDANISITVSPKGSGDFVVDVGDIQNTAGDIIATRSSAGGDVTVEATNSDNTDPASRGGFEAAVGGTSAGDPYMNFLISGGQTFTMGIDNSTTNDDFVISDNATLGTNNRVSIDGSSGIVTLGSGLTSGGTTSINDNVNANTSINTGTSTGTVSIGSSNAGAITVDSGAGIDITSAEAATSDGINIEASAADGGITLTSGSGGINLDGVFLVNDSVNSNSSINTGTSTGTVSIGNSAAGAITLDTAAGISIDGATASNFTVTGAADLTLSSTAGSVPISAGEAATDAIALTASAGGIDVDGALEVNITSSEAAVADAVTISASAADGGITLDAGVTPGVTFTNGTQSHQMLVGSGSPNGSVTASQGSLYVDVAGSTSTTILFVNTDGSTTWVGVGA